MRRWSATLCDDPAEFVRRDGRGRLKGSRLPCFASKEESDDFGRDKNKFEIKFEIKFKMAAIAHDKLKSRSGKLG